MYEQDTSFGAANTPLFSQLFGSSCGPRRRSFEKESFISRETCGGPRAGVCHGESTPPSPPPSAPVAPVLSDGGVSEASAVPGEDAAAEGSCIGLAVNGAAFEQDEPGTPGRPKVPFRQVMRELGRRFQEQMEVHRGLRASMRQLDLLCDEISLFQTERRTAGLASALCRQSMPFVEPAWATVTATAPAAAPASAAPQPAGGSCTSFVRPLLEKALRSYVEERPNKARRVEEAVPPKSKETRRTLPVDVVRPPEEPRPYTRVYYVPVVKTPEGAHGGASYSTLVTSRSTSAVPTTVPYTEDFESSGGVSTDLSASNISSSTNVVTSSMSIEDSSGMMHSSSHSVNALTSTTKSSVIEEESTEMHGPGVDGISLLTTLQEFYNACGSANRLMQALLGPDGNMRHAQIKDNNEAALKMTSVTTPKDNDGRHVWLSSLRRDVGDVRKLRRFIDHMKRNMKSLDCQRKAQEAKQRLLVKAQRLARAHQRMRHDKSTLSDVIDDISDLMENEATRSSDGEVVDEVSTAAALSWGSVVDETVEDNVVAMANDSDAMDDEVVDELGDAGTWNAGRPGDEDTGLPHEVVSELTWATVESDYANALVEASDVDDMLGDDVPLPSGEEETREVDNDIPPTVLEGSSTLTEVDDELAGSLLDVASKEPQRNSATRFHDDDVPDSSFLNSSRSDDADVSSVLPASSASLLSDSVDGQTGGDYDHDETDSAESALDALERDLKETEPRRARALLSVHPAPFTPLYTAGGADTMTPSSFQEAPEQTPNCDKTVAEAPVVQPAESGLMKSADAAPPVGDEASEAAIELPRTNACSAYAAEDLVAQLQWKERQLALLRQLRPKTAWEREREKEGIEDKTTAATHASTPVEEKADYHWGVIETLLQCRFACAENEPLDDDAMLDDNANESSWTDAYDDTAAYTSSDVELSANGECSPRAV